MAPTRVARTDFADCVEIALNRPEKCNALDAELIQVMIKLLNELAGRKSPPPIVFRGVGRIFCAGLDFKWLAELASKPLDRRVAALATYVDLVQTIQRYPNLVIVDAYGSAYGGAIGLISSADIVLCHADAKFSLPEGSHGLYPAMVLPLLTLRMQPAAALSFCSIGREWDSQMAATRGLVDLVYRSENDVGRILEDILKCADPEAAVGVRLKGWAADVSRDARCRVGEFLMRGCEMFAEQLTHPAAELSVSSH